MQILTYVNLMEAYCRLSRTWAIYISIDEEDDWGEVVKAAPVLKTWGDGTTQLLVDGSGVILFDTEDEMKTAYNSIYHKKYGSETNPYKGTASVYALSCGPDGLLDENV